MRGQKRQAGSRGQERQAESRGQERQPVADSPSLVTESRVSVARGAAGRVPISANTGSTAAAGPPAARPLPPQGRPLRASACRMRPQPQPQPPQKVPPCAAQACSGSGPERGWRGQGREAEQEAARSLLGRLVCGRCGWGGGSVGHRAGSRGGVEGVQAVEYQHQLRKAQPALIHSASVAYRLSPVSRPAVHAVGLRSLGGKRCARTLDAGPATACPGAVRGRVFGVRAHPGMATAAAWALWSVTCLGVKHSRA